MTQRPGPRRKPLARLMTPAEYNRQLPAPGDYARSWRTLIDLDPEVIVNVPGYIVGMHGWGRRSVTAGEALRQVRTAANNRINARGGLEPREPRESTISLWRDSRRVQDHLTRRVVIHQFETKAARERFAHLLSEWPS